MQPHSTPGASTIAPTRKPRYNYTENRKTLYSVPVDMGDATIEVVGDPDNGSYEWIVRRPDSLTHSDGGYGQPEIALRDGLIAYFGLPAKGVNAR